MSLIAPWWCILYSQQTFFTTCHNKKSDGALRMAASHLVFQSQSPTYVHEPTLMSLDSLWLSQYLLWKRSAHCVVVFGFYVLVCCTNDAHSQQKNAWEEDAGKPCVASIGGRRDKFPQNSPRCLSDSWITVCNGVVSRVMAGDSSGSQWYCFVQENRPFCSISWSCLFPAAWAISGELPCEPLKVSDFTEVIRVKAGRAEKNFP